jgi:hypothetical protein
MDYIIKTGTDSEGNAVTTTLNVQMNFTWEYVSHETQNFVNNQEMPQRRENDMVKTVRIKVTGNDTTSSNASYLVEGQNDQEHEEFINVYLPWRAKANGELSGFITPYENVTDAIMLNWAKSHMQEDDKLLALKDMFAQVLYGDRHHPDL